MKTTPAQASSFLQKPDPRVRVVLIYGPDAGLVRERADELANKVVPGGDDPFRVTLLSIGDVTGDAARLCDESAMQALGGGRRLVRLPHATEAATPALTALLDRMPEGDSFVLIEAGDLDKRSKLRSLAESDNPAVIAIACYVEDAGQRSRTIAAMLESEGLKAPRDVVQRLVEILPPDRMAMRREMEKLALYAKGQASVSLDDLRAVLNDAGAAETDDFIQAVALGDARRASQMLDHLFAEQTTGVALLRAAQRHFLRLQLARAQVDAGLGAREAVEKLQPKVFWKHVEPMTRQVQRWSSGAIEKFLRQLYDAEIQTKSTGIPDTALVAQMMLKAAG